MKGFPAVLYVGYTEAEDGLHRLLRLVVLTTSMCHVPHA